MTAASTMLEATTQELWLRSKDSAVDTRLPLLARLRAENRQNFTGGSVIKRSIRKALRDENVQWYLPDTTLTDSDKTTLTTAEWGIKYAQIDIKWRIDEKLKNAGKAQVVDLVGEKVDNAQTSLMRKVSQGLYTASSDSGTAVQSIVDACGHSRTYGAITSNTSTAAYWNGASIGGVYTDSAGAQTISFALLRRMLQRCKAYAMDARNGDFMFLLGESLFATLADQADATVIRNSPTGLARFGYSTLEMQGAEIVCDPWLGYESMSYSSANTTPGGLDATLAKYLACLYVPSWELWVAEEDEVDRNFGLGPVVHQAGFIGGKDVWLQRAYFAGNVICRMPIANMLLTNVS